MSPTNFDHLKSAAPEWCRPQIIAVSNDTELAKVQELIKQQKISHFFDTTEYAIEELYDIAYPHQKDLPKQQKVDFADFAMGYAWPKGVFVYFPWDNALIRFPRKEDLRALRTSRNRNLITADEQAKLYKATILIAGLSVGSNIVEALVSMGIGSKFILADMDVIEPSNLNRIRSPYKDVGVHKADAVAMRMSQIDPYLEFELYREGVTSENLREILDLHQPTVIVDEMDQVQLKISLRKEAKARRLPVLSAADDGDSTLIDIERYDQEPAPELFNGLIPQDILDYLESSTDIPRQQLGMLIGRYFVGPAHIPLRMYQSLGEVGKTLPSWPQLGGAATQSGLAVAFAARKIILQQPLRHGRFIIGSDQVLDPQLEDAAYKAELAVFQQQLGSFTFSPPAAP